MARPTEREIYDMFMAMSDEQLDRAERLVRAFTELAADEEPPESPTH
jgi:hypothetical protein